MSATPATASAATSTVPGPARSRWAPLLDKLESGDRVHGEGRTLETLAPPLTKTEQDRLRWAAGWRGRRIRMRTTPAATTVWLGGTIEGYRNRKRSKPTTTR